jgi:Tfp pilus assembly PilM family ATPase
MNVPRTLVALSIEHDRLVAIAASVGERVRVKGWHTAPVPAEVDIKDAAAVGKWLGAELGRAGMQRGRIIISVPRGEVVLKRLRLPKADATELAGMVRLQMAKQLTMALDGTAIDYVPIEAKDSMAGAPTEGASAVAVLAAALPGDRMAWYRGVAKAAGCRIERVGLRAAGLGALLGDVSQRHTGPILGVSVGWSSVEFVVVEQGELVFVRAADVGMDASPASGEGEQAAAAAVHRVGVEVKRTWMSYRVGEGSAEIDAVVVPGEGELSREIAQRCGEALEMPWKLAGLPSVVEIDGTMPDAQFQIAAPLIGLLAEEAIGRPMLDFAHPRKAPDLAAAKRQRVLAAAFALLAVVGAGYLYTSMQLQELHRQVKEAKDKGSQLRTQYGQMLLEEARLQHIRHWTKAEVDWMAHAAYLSEQFPDPRQAQLDSLTGVLGAKVEFVAKDGQYDPNGWSVPHGGRLSMAGTAKSRETANQFRIKLLNSEVYAVDTKGADVGDAMKFELTTTRPRPEEEPPKTRAAIRPARGAAGLDVAAAGEDAP